MTDDSNSRSKIFPWEKCVFQTFDSYDSSLRLSALGVLLVHVILLFLVYFQPFTPSKTSIQPRAKQKITIETIHFPPPENRANSTPVPQVAQKASPIETGVPAPKAVAPEQKQLTEAKPAAPATSAVKRPVAQTKLHKASAKPTARGKIPTTASAPAIPAAVPSVAAPQHTNKLKLLAQARENLQKVQSTKSTAVKNTTSEIKGLAASAETPKVIGNLQSEAFIASEGSSGGSREANYQDEILSRLKSQLQLVEYGSVDIELTLDRNGKILHLKVIRDENRANRLYIETNVPQMRFPGFGASFPGEQQHTFFIRLSNLI